jgi:peptidoglycan hydrolase CwlO-like protein
MEITSFVLGMLSIIAVAIVAVIVVGMLKINKLEKSNNNLQQLCRDIDLSLRTLISDTNRELTMVERTIMQRIDKEIEDAHRHIHDEVEEIHKHEHELETVLHRDIDETRRYIDSRIDKVVLSGTIKEPKRQILNG